MIIPEDLKHKCDPIYQIYKTLDFFCDELRKLPRAGRCKAIIFEGKLFVQDEDIQYQRVFLNEEGALVMEDKPFDESIDDVDAYACCNPNNIFRF